MNLSAVYKASGRELRAMLLSMDLEGQTENEAMRIQEKARQLIQTLNYAAKKWVETDLVKAYNKAAKKAKTILQILGKKPKRPPIEDPTIKVKEDAYAVLLRSNKSITETVDQFLAAVVIASKQIRNIQIQEFDKGQAFTDIEEMAEEVVKTGASRGILKKQVFNYLKENVKSDNFIVINGKNYKMGKYAEMVARTEMRKAGSKATKELCREYDNDLIEVSDHGTDTEICQIYEGNVYSLNGQTPGYDIIDMLPPFHPNCQHSILPTSVEAIEVREKYD